MNVYLPSDRVEATTELRPFTPPVPVVPIFLDLPLLTGQEVPHAPHIVVGADPWPGSVALWSSSEDAGYEINRLMPASCSDWGHRIRHDLTALTMGLWAAAPS